MTNALVPVLPYFIIVSLVLSSAIPTMERIHGSIARQYARVALAIVGVSDPLAYRFYDETATLLREFFPSVERPHSLVAFDETQDIPTAQEWRTVQNQLTNLEQLGNRIAKQLEGRG